MNKKEINYTDISVSRKEQPGGLVQEAALSYESLVPESSLSALPPELRGKKQGAFTLEDYLLLPEEERWELIDGYLIRMESPTTVHQFLLSRILIAFTQCADAHEEECECLVFVSPTDVQLDMDDRTIVEPDLIVLCDRKKLQDKRIYGAPDLLVEILSPSTKSKDLLWKKEKYGRAGVREYWIIDDALRTVTVCVWDGQKLPLEEVYGFDAEIPVRISGGRCSIDFREIARRMDRAYRREG